MLRVLSSAPRNMADSWIVLSKGMLNEQQMQRRKGGKKGKKKRERQGKKKATSGMGRKVNRKVLGDQISEKSTQDLKYAVTTACIQQSLH